VPFDYASIDPADYRMDDKEQRNKVLTALFDFSWFDGCPESLPLVVAVDEQDQVLARWTGRDVANPDQSWLVAVRLTLLGRDVEQGRVRVVEVVESEPPELPIGA
jgi:hypothetical protein